MTTNSRTSEWDSGQFQGSRWGPVEVVTDIPPRPRRDDPKAVMYAELAYFELGHLLPGERVKLTGNVEATFWKLEEDTVLCHLNGGAGVYQHDSDVNWEERRLQAERYFTALFTGEKM